MAFKSFARHPPPLTLESQQYCFVVVVIFVVLDFFTKVKAVVFASQEEALERRTEEWCGSRYDRAAGLHIWRGRPRCRDHQGLAAATTATAMVMMRATKRVTKTTTAMMMMGTTIATMMITITMVGTATKTTATVTMATMQWRQ
jgi:hypothetical protein